jgi:hypothetical protein
MIAPTSKMKGKNGQESTMRRPGGSNNTMEYRMDYVVSLNSNIYINSILLV